jgi:hypothetical protein
MTIKLGYQRKILSGLQSSFGVVIIDRSSAIIDAS